MAYKNTNLTDILVPSAGRTVSEQSDCDPNSTPLTLSPDTDIESSTPATPVWMVIADTIKAEEYADAFGFVDDIYDNDDFCKIEEDSAVSDGITQELF